MILASNEEQLDIRRRYHENAIQERKERKQVIAEHQARWKVMEDELMTECGRKLAHAFQKATYVRGYMCINCGQYKEQL